MVLSKAPAHRFAARLRGHIVKLQTLEAEAAMAEKNEDASSDEVDEKLESPSVREQVQAPPQLEVPQRNKRPRQKLSPLQTLLRKAAKSLDDGDPILAMKYYREALVIKADNIDALTGLGFCYLAQDSLPAAFSTFEQALRQAKDFSEAHRGLGKLWRARGNREKALEHFRHYLKVLPMGSHAASVRTAIMELEMQSNQ